MTGALRLDAVFASPLGRLGIVIQAGALSRVAFLPRDHGLIRPVEPLATLVVERLRAFFDDPCADLDMELHLSGTAFQQRVWRALQRIDVGTVCTYGALARRLATSAQAVGNACRANPVPIVVPCHRVVASRGVGGFAGHSSGRLISIKRQLLRHEGVEM